MTDYSILTPEWNAAPEIIDVDEPNLQFTAMKQTGAVFSEKYSYMDGLRYAIAIQQHRDKGDYDTADAARDIVISFGYDVGTAGDRTVVSGLRFGTY